MNIETLRYFQYIAKFKNFTRAAEHFHISQSSLSRQISNLERELEVTLFTRGNRKVALTEAGEELYDSCELIIRHLDNLSSTLRAIDKGQQGSLSIATLGSYQTLLQKIHKKFIDRYPKVTCFYEHIEFEDLSNSILHGIHDIAITLDFVVPEVDGISSLTLQEDEFLVVIHKDIAEDLGESIYIDELKNFQIILPLHKAPPFMKALSKRDYKNNDTGIVYVPTTETAIIQAALGLGVTIMPRSLVKESVDHALVKLCRIEDIDTVFNIVAIWRDHNKKQTLHNYIEVLKNI